MNQETIIEKLKELAPGGRISCADARKLAERLDVEKAEIGKACDEAGIRVFACDLGCF